MIYGNEYCDTLHTASGIIIILLCLIQVIPRYTILEYVISTSQVSNAN